MQKNYKFLKALSWRARNNPSTWVIDPENEEFIDWSKPSKNRLNAYQLDGTRTIIYLNDKTYTEQVREDWRCEKADQKYSQTCISLDYLFDNYDLEPCQNGRLITHDNYYDFIVDDADLEETDAKVYLINKVRSIMASLGDVDRKVAELLSVGYTTREIAKELGISQTAVMKRINKLRKIFNDLKDK